MKGDFKVPKKSSGLRLSSKGTKNFALVAIVLVIVVLAIIAQKTLIAKDREEVKVLVAGTSSILPSNSQLSEKNIDFATIDKLALTNEMITKEMYEKDFKGQWTTLPLRHGSYIFKDLLAKESAKESGWIYTIPKDGIAISIPFDSLDLGGKTVRPGDRIAMQNAFTSQLADGTTSVNVQDIFSSVRIIDLLNSDGGSIKQIYKEVMGLSTEERNAKLNSKEFQQSISPSRLIVVTDKVGFTAWSKAKASGQLRLSFGILSRDFELDKAIEDFEINVQQWKGGN